ncbi:class I SAM-dependent methyltransferase [Nocardioides dongkuii]|uniref:class I SAM-dependent methyltransferase n=1 Tax=Nocardioides dongkuii TaxID=2760089 RepID=UPI0015FB9B65|nr:methyltransferase domain-containing protein [Nocardioides dongkuii]
MSTTTDLAADRALKAKHRAVWALGDYPAVAAEIISDLGPTLVEACRIAPGDRVLDVAAGSGNVAVPAAAAGASVVASDLTPELLDVGRRHAADAGVEVEWAEGDAEALPYADHTFDVVTSSVGVMFAPHHQAAADELVRVCRPGGRIGLISWTPEGYIGQMFATMKGYVAPPPPGVQPPPLWGSEEHVRGLLGDRVVDLVAERRSLPVRRFATGAELRDYFKARYGPTIAAYRGIADQPERVAELDAALAALPDRFGGVTQLDWEYLLVTARTAG